MTIARPFAVLFDLDGTLIDSIGLLLECVHYTFEGRTPAPTDAEWIAGIGTPLGKQLGAYASSEAEIEGLTNRYRSFQREQHDLLTTAFPGVLDTLVQLERRGNPMGIVTSKSNEMMNRGLAWVGIDKLMSTTIGMDSCNIHKPEPFPVLLALEELGYSPDEAVFVGDSPHDILSGNAAGVTSIAAMWGPFSKAQLEAARPNIYLDRIEDLLPVLDELQSAKLRT
jgi:pyrophosphatase PpaX